MRTLIKNQYIAHKETIHNFGWRFLQMFGKQGITFLIFILCAKLLTPYDFGIYNYILAIIYLLIMFGDFGISTAVSKYVAEYNVSDQEKLKEVLFNSGLIIFGFTSVVIVASLFLGPNFFKEKYIYILYLLPLIFLAPMTSLYDGIFRGLKRFKESAVISLVVGFVSIFSCYFLVKIYGLKGALVSQNIFYFLLVIGYAFRYKELHFKFNKRIMKEFLKYSALIGFADLGIYLFTRADVVILGAFNHINEIAYYELANKIFMLLAIPFSVFAQVLAPDITSSYVQKKYSQIKLQLNKFLKYSVAIGVLISVVSYGIIRFITPYFLAQYNNKTFYLFFGFLLIILPIRLFGTIFTTAFLIPTNKARILTYNNIVFGIINVISDIIFIYFFGAIGVIFSTLLLGYLSVAVAYYYFRVSIVKDEQR